ncbi:MAG: 23S rRNA (guanosine(2251)-2'-O)-methyltransferase RlmB, partial [Planctomycetaceae bacterium]|nr:23S rRNA (guanosine(2251)-2'-O)-methyltransferase RlmB [Planctomycetaceae bacterium]
MSLNPLPEFLELKNPHSIWEALVRRPRDFKELRFHTEPHGIWRKIAEAAREKKIPVRDLPAPKQKHPAQSKGAGKQERTGHAVALVRPR